MFGRNSNIKAEEFLVCVSASDEAHGVFEAFHRLLAFLVSYLAGLIGVHFQVLGVSPLQTHFTLVLLFIMATIVYSIAYVEIKLQPQDADLPIFRSICLVSGIIAIELLVAIIISPFWPFRVNFCPILLVGVLSHSYRRISQCLYYTVHKIYELGCKTYDWLLQKFQYAASQAFSLREQEDNGIQREEIV